MQMKKNAFWLQKHLIQFTLFIMFGYSGTVLWINTGLVRNIIFRLVDVWSKRRSLKYCLSNAAAQVASELIQAMEVGSTNKVPIKVSNPTQKSDFNSILSALLGDLEAGENLIVPCEMTTGDPGSSESINLTPTGDSPNEAEAPQSGPFGKYYDSDSLVWFINPQINFEVSISGTGTRSLMMGAKNMHVKFLREIDSEIELSDLNQSHQDRIANFRNIWTLTNAQFMVQTTVENSGSDQDQDEDEGGLKWAPLECLVNSEVKDRQFVRIIENCDVIFQSDKENPLYVNRHKNSKKTSHPNSFKLQIPELKVASASKEYVALSNLFTKLLIYRDPRSGENSSKARKMLLTLEQSEDLAHFKFLIPRLQEKLKRIEYLVNYGGNSPNRKKMLMEYRTNLNNHLYVLIEGLKNLHSLEKKRRSFEVDWKLTIKIESFMWLMLQDHQAPLCRWVLSNLSFVSVNNEDLSSKNTLEVDYTQVENLLAGAVNNEVFAPYYTERLSFDHQKLVRVYWHENTPVAGIKIVDHFEINFHPLMIQMTFEFGKQMANYIFPSRQSSGGDSPTIASRDDLEVKLDEPQTSVAGQIIEMQSRADRNRSFIYIKVPGVQHCISYRGPKEKNLEDLQNFVFFVPTLEYRNQTWSWYDLLNALKKGNDFLNVDVLRAALANTGALVREKLFVKRPIQIEDSSTFGNESASDISADVFEDRQKLSPMAANSSASSLLRDSITRRASLRIPKSNSMELALPSLSLHSGMASNISLADSFSNSMESTLMHKGKLILGKRFSIRRSMAS
jgi:hypothetical protein